MVSKSNVIRAPLSYFFSAPFFGRCWNSLNETTMNIVNKRNDVSNGVFNRRVVFSGADPTYESDLRTYFEYL